MKLLAVLAGGALLGATAMGASAQTPHPSEPSAPSIVQPAQMSIPGGTLVKIEIAEEISTKTRRPGETFAIRLSEPLILDGQVIIAAGAVGRGEIVHAKPAGMLGAGGEIILAARYLEVGGERIRLRGFSFGQSGANNSGAILAASFVPYVGYAAILITGGNVVIAPGASAQAKIAVDTLLTLPAKADPGSEPNRPTAPAEATSPPPLQDPSAAPSSN